MFSLKISSLIGGLIFCAGLMIVCGYLPFAPVEQPLKAQSDEAVNPAKVPNLRFDQVEYNGNLQAEADALLPLFDQMPPVSIYLKDDPILKSGTEIETGNAYTQCENNRLPSIFVKKNYYLEAHRTRLINTLKHELTHAWLCRQQIMSVSHGELFRRKLKQVGGWMNRSK